MKNLLRFLLLFATIPQLMAGVDYALVVKERDGKFYNHPEAKGYDFRACLEDFDLLHVGKNCDDSTFGPNIRLVAKIDGKAYILEVDAQYGVFSLYAAKRQLKAPKLGSNWRVSKKIREFFLPELYDSLRKAGLNIYTGEEIKAMTKEERMKVINGKTSPVK